MSDWRTLKLVKNDHHIVTLSLSRIERRNAINQELASELVACLTDLSQRRDLRVLVLTGEGSSFCSGGDLKERLKAGPKESRQQRNMALRAVELLDKFPCPVIAMINGSALAGGLELALACDIRVASDGATFGLPEVRTAGGFPGGGGPIRLEKLIGRGRSGLVVYTGKAFTASQAFDLGIVDLIFPSEQLREETYALASQIAANSPAGVRAAKQLIRQSMDLDVSSATELSSALRDPLDDTPDFYEAINAWTEKRDPKFRDLVE